MRKLNNNHSEIPKTLYQDRYFLVLSKNAGIPVQKDLTGDLSIWEIAEHHFGYKIHLATRLDRPVSGAVIFSKSSKGIKYLDKIKSNNRLKKTYYAFVEKGNLKLEGHVQHYILKNAKHRKSLCSKEKLPGSKLAEMNYSIIETIDNYHFVEVRLNSGKFHQIRSQFSAMDCPVKGDVKYGARRRNSDRSIHLHCHQIEFPKVDEKGIISVISDFPSNDNLWNLADQIIGDLRKTV